MIDHFSDRWQHFDLHKYLYERFIRQSYINFSIFFFLSPITPNTTKKIFPLTINCNLSSARGTRVPLSRSQKTHRYHSSIRKVMTSQSGEFEIRLSYLDRGSTRDLHRGCSLLHGDVSYENLNRKSTRPRDKCPTKIGDVSRLIYSHEFFFLGRRGCRSNCPPFVFPSVRIRLYPRIERISS